MPPMRVEGFVDTNVLLYAASTSPDEAQKRERARTLLARSDWGLSVQVLQELYVNLVRPRREIMSHDDAVALIRQLLRRPLVVSDRDLLLQALDMKQRYQLSYWDSAIVAAARGLGACILYTEDLSHGQEYNGVRVENPFLKC
jgi:predicted nucleic acid-binding protein